MRRFGLKTLFGIVALAAFGSLALRHYWLARPPTQQVFTARDLQNHLRDGKTVMVTIDADWALKPPGRPRYMSAKVSQLVRERGIVAMTADWTTRTPEADLLMQSLQQNGAPALAIYSPEDPGNPVILAPQADESQVLHALESVRER